MITVKNKEINENTIKIINELLEKEIKVSAAFKLSKIIKELSNIIEATDSLQRKIFEKYAVKDADGNYEKVYDESGNIREGAVRISDPEKYNSEMSELLELENIINVDKININDLGIDTISTKTLISLEFLFSE